MSPIVTAAGQYTERQALALRSPCRHAREWGPGDYRKVIRRGQVDLLTFLAFDWFEKSKPVWHVAVAILIAPQTLKPVALWDYNDQAQAVRLASELLGTAGDASKGRWAHKTEDGLDLYRAAAPLEIIMARGVIGGMAPLPPFFDAKGIPELEAMINERNGQLATLSSGCQATGGDRDSAQIVHRRTIKAERVGDA